MISCLFSLKYFERMHPVGTIKVQSIIHTYLCKIVLDLNDSFSSVAGLCGLIYNGNSGLNFLICIIELRMIHVCRFSVFGNLLYHSSVVLVFTYKIG